VKRFFCLAWNDVLSGLDRALERGPRGLVLALAGLLAGWWLYVPLHELLHAVACLASGGEVTRLEIAPEYGGRFLAGWLPWVAAGSEYAGQLTGFDTRGSDLRYLATDLGPFLLTLFPGVWALRRAARRGLVWAWGGSLPFALAPFLSLTGDAYEMGSIVVTQAPVFAPSVEAVRLLRGDDLAKVALGLPGGLYPGFAAAALLGLAWSFAWYWVADRFSRALGAPASAGTAQEGSRSG